MEALKVPQGETPGWLVLGGSNPGENIMALASDEVTAVLWEQRSNKIHISSRTDGLLTLDCAGIECAVQNWQRKLVLALLLGAVDRLPLSFEALAAQSSQD